MDTPFPYTRPHVYPQSDTPAFVVRWRETTTSDATECGPQDFAHALRAWRRAELAAERTLLADGVPLPDDVIIDLALLMLERRPISPAERSRRGLQPEASEDWIRSPTRDELRRLGVELP